MTELGSPTFTISNGPWTAKISALGAALADLKRDGISLLAHPEVVDPKSGFHGAVLAPWPGRVPFGKYRFEGLDNELAISEPQYGHALHGLVADKNWVEVAHSKNSITLTYSILPQQGYAHSVDLSIRYDVSDIGLQCTSTWTNRSDNSAPFGIGFHPYFTLGQGVDSMDLELPAAISVDSDMATKVPMAVRSVHAQDFVARRTIGPDTFARCYGQLPRIAGWVHATLTQAGIRGIKISADEAFGWFQVYTGDLPRKELFRTGFALEPQTCPPGAFSSGLDLMTLAPGETGHGTWTVQST